MKTAYLFSGQGSQYPGMGKELYDEFASVRTVYECGSDLLGFDLARLSFEGSEQDLAPTKVAQPAIFAVSMAAFTAVQERAGIPAEAFAGHSLGEYAALTASGALTLENGFRLIAARAAAMQRGADANPGAMYAIVGSDEQSVTEACEQATGYVLPVNFNALNQTVIAGEEAAAQAAADLLASKGAKAVRLAVSSGFHSKLMETAAAEFLETAKNVPFGQPSKTFYSNLTGKPLENTENLAAYLARHIVSPVLFHQEISRMLEDGLEQFIECGPGKVLTMLVKRGFKGAQAFNVENLKTLEKLPQA